MWLKVNKMKENTDVAWGRESSKGGYNERW
jgi:hypothetical protein